MSVVFQTNRRTFYCNISSPCYLSLRRAKKELQRLFFYFETKSSLSRSSEGVVIRPIYDSVFFLLRFGPETEDLVVRRDECRTVRFVAGFVGFDLDLIQVFRITELRD